MHASGVQPPSAGPWWDPAPVLPVPARHTIGACRDSIISRDIETVDRALRSDTLMAMVAFVFSPGRRQFLDTLDFCSNWFTCIRCWQILTLLVRAACRFRPSITSHWRIRRQWLASSDAYALADLITGAESLGEFVHLFTQG